jgi:copper(I)-binding protein
MAYQSRSATQPEMILERSALAVLLLVSLMSCSARSAIEVQDPWARDTVGRTANAAVFMKIESVAADRLIGASATVANKADLMAFEGGTDAMRMRYVEGIDIPGNGPVSLDPSGLHVWLSGLKAPLRQGQTFPLSLRFKNAGDRRVTVKVIGPSAPPPRP